MKRLFISVVIAALNEEKNIKPLVERLLEVLGKKYDYELIFPVAGTDKTAGLLKSFKNKKIKILYSRNPRGIGLDFKKGFEAVSGKADYVITMDADLNHQPEEIPRLLKFANAYDIVIGSRHVKGSITTSIPFFKRMISNFTNMIFNMVSDIDIHDKTSGFRLYRRDVLSTIAKEYARKDFTFLTEILYISRKHDFRIKEVPITFIYRVAGKSKFNFVKVGAAYSLFLWKTLVKRLFKDA